MSKKQSSIFKAIGDPTRRQIIHLLLFAGQALTINQLVENFPASRQGVSKHLKVLEGAGFVEIKTEGRQRLCFANPEPLKDVYKWVASYEKFWSNKLDDLEDFLKKKS